MFSNLVWQVAQLSMTFIDVLFVLHPPWPHISHPLWQHTHTSVLFLQNDGAHMGEAGLAAFSAAAINV